MPTIAAYAYKHSIGQPFMYPRNDLSYVGNLLYMMFGTPCETYVVDPVVEKAIDLLLILHADHEQNCSTSTVRLVGSSMVNLFAAISSGIKALWGPSHGGEPGRDRDAQSIAGGQTRDSSTRGRGRARGSWALATGSTEHDPRAIIRRSATCSIGWAPQQALDIAMKLEDIALKDDYFISRKLYPNVDFYSGLIYKALGIPVNMFTVMFAIGRLPGWIAHGWR
jgi:citrate synthase